MDEKLKKQLMLAFIGFNICFMIYQFGFNNTPVFSIVSWAIAFGVGAVGAAIGFVLGKFVG